MTDRYNKSNRFPLVESFENFTYMGKEEKLREVFDFFEALNDGVAGSNTALTMDDVISAILMVAEQNRTVRERSKPYGTKYTKSNIADSGNPNMWSPGKMNH